jgi:hypothetical protein
MAGTVHRRHPATTWPVAAVLLALLFSGLATGRVPELVGTAPHVALASSQAAIHDTAHWVASRPLRGKATSVLATTGSGLFAPGPAAVLAGAFALLLAGVTAWRARPRRIGRMHAGRGPPRLALP